MKLSHSTTSARLSQRFAHPLPTSTPAPRREASSVRPAPRDGFEGTAPSRSGNVQSLFQRQFGALATDKQGFHETMRGIFGGGYDTAKAEQYRQQALAGNFDWMPPVQWVDAQVLQGGHGAYDAQSGKVLLSRDLQGNPALAASTYVEEAGHHLDARLNTVDSQGDEGELFRRVLGGEKLSGAQLAEIRAENDKGTIQLDGQSVDVEFRRRNLFQRIGKAVGDAVDAVGDAVGDAAEAVGNAVGGAAASVLGGAVGGVLDVLGSKGLTKKWDLPSDGQFVGVGGTTFPPGTPLDQMPGITPSYNANPQTTVLYVNGILTSLQGQVREMQELAEATGMRVIGIHNSTEGAVADIGQAIQDKLDKGRNPPVDTLADTVYSELMAGRSVHLMGYSHGALITARALKDVANRLRIENGLSREQVEAVMSRINVETFGGAGAIFPDGPSYVHYINDRDIVPGFFGLGNGWDPFRDGGRDAKIHHFSEAGRFDFVQAHDLDSTYLQHRVPFEDARQGNF